MVPPLFRRKRFFVPAGIVLALAIGAAVHVVRTRHQPPELAFSEFLQLIERGNHIVVFEIVLMRRSVDFRVVSCLSAMPEEETTEGDQRGAT